MADLVTMKFTCVTSLVIVLFVKLVEPCNEMLIKKMAISSCGLNKRSFASDDNSLMSILFGLAFDAPLNKNIEQEFQKLVAPIHEADLPPKKSDKKKSRGFTTGQPRRPRPPSTGRPRPPSAGRPRNLMLSTDEPSLILELIADENAGKASEVVKRDLETLVKECCSRTCTIEDFRGMCDKK